MQESISILDAKERLRKLILNNGLKWDEGLLRDIQIPKWIFDLREIILTSEGSRLTSLLLYEKIKNLDFDIVGGPSIAAEPLVASLIMHFYKEGRNISGFVVRKKPNNFGLRKKVEGPIKGGNKVILIDDAINSGFNLLDSVNELKQQGCDIVKIITIIDFLKSGNEKLKEGGYDIDYIFDLEDFGLEINKTYKYKKID